MNGTLLSNIRFSKNGPIILGTPNVYVAGGNTFGEEGSVPGYHSTKLVYPQAPFGVNFNGYKMTGDFAIHLRLKHIGTSKSSFNQALWDDQFCFLAADGGAYPALCLVQQSYSRVISGNVNLLDGTWKDILISRSGSTLRVFFDGIMAGSITFTSPVGATTWIDSASSAHYCDCLYDDLAIIDGSACYTSNYTVNKNAYFIDSLEGLEGINYVDEKHYIHGYK